MHFPKQFSESWVSSKAVQQGLDFDDDDVRVAILARLFEPRENLESTKIRGGLQHKIFRINGDFRSPEESSRENANVFEVVKTGSAQLGPRTISKLSAHPPDFSGLWDPPFDITA